MSTQASPVAPAGTGIYTAGHPAQVFTTPNNTHNNHPHPFSAPSADTIPRIDSSNAAKAKALANGTADGKSKPHICTICERGFTTGGHLQRHQRIHTGVKAFRCPFPGCETRTSRQDNLQQHYRTHLSPTLRRGSGSAARAAVAQAMEAAGLKSSSSRSRKSKGSGTGTPSSVSTNHTSHVPSPYQTPTSQGGPSPFNSYMYEPHGYPPYPLGPPAINSSQSGASSRVPSPANGHSSHSSSVGSLPYQPHFPQGFSPYGYPVHQPYRHGQPGVSPYGPPFYSPGMTEHNGTYTPISNFPPNHSREGSYGVLTPGYPPHMNGYPPRTQTSTPLSQTHDDDYRRARPASPRRRSPEMLQGVVDPSSMNRQTIPPMQPYGGYPQPPIPYYQGPMGPRDVTNRASISSLSDNGSGNGGSDNSKVMHPA